LNVPSHLAGINKSVVLNSTSADKRPFHGTKILLATDHI